MARSVQACAHTTQYTNTPPYYTPTTEKTCHEFHHNSPTTAPRFPPKRAHGTPFQVPPLKNRPENPQPESEARRAKALLTSEAARPKRADKALQAPC
jgi:hypothetical protein